MGWGKEVLDSFKTQGFWLQLGCWTQEKVPRRLAEASWGTRADVCPSPTQDGVLLGAVGAYDWNGAVLKETSGGKVIPLRESYLKEFPEELKNHAAYLGEGRVGG